MTKRDFQPGVSECPCGAVAHKWLDDAPCCPRCERRDAVPRAETTGHGAPRHDVALSDAAHDGALTMNDIAILESAL